MDTKLTLVLGAGASAWLGFPLGIGLRNSILQLGRPERDHFVSRAGLYNFGSARLQEFISEFQQSQMYSIDAFLARRAEFVDIGKASIAALLLESECNGSLFTHQSKDDWYRYFYNKFASEKWDDLDFSNLTVLTFNYDRSLEFFLIGAIQASYGKTREDACLRLSTLEIIHLYGSLGSHLEDSDHYLEYGAEITTENVNKASKSLKVIPEGRDDDELLTRARTILTSSDAVAFLGFGFDETNMQRLALPQTCTERKQTQEGIRIRQILATTRNFTRAESLRIVNLLGLASGRIGTGTLVPDCFDFQSCLALLNESLILDKFK